MARSSSWKQDEREIAARLSRPGLKVIRNPSNGRRNADINAGRFALECKKRIDVPAWFTQMMAQAVFAGQQSQAIPIATVTHAAGRGHPKKRYVVMEWETFVALYDEITEQQAHSAAQKLHGGRA